MKMDIEYLNEILGEGGSDFSSVNASISKIIEHADMLKIDVTTMLENQSFKFHSTLNENFSLKFQAENLLKEMNLVEEEIEKEVKKELDDCKLELESLSYSLKEINLFIYKLMQIIGIHSHLLNAKKNFENKDYYKCAQLIKTLENDVKFNSEKLKRIKVFKKLSLEISEMHKCLLHKINEVWCDGIKFNTDESVSSNDVCEILLSINIKALSTITNIVSASYHLNSCLNEKNFSTVLLKDFLSPIISHETEVITKSENGTAILLLKIFKAGGKPEYLKVIENFKQIFNFIKTHLQFNVENKKSFLSLMGYYIAADVSDNLIKNYLSEVIPSNSEEFNNYEKIVKAAIDFENYLHDIEFLPEDSSSITTYAKNIKAIFAKKFSQAFLNKARTVMKKDIHDVTMSEEVTSNINILPSFKNTLQNLMNNKEDIFILSRCLISKHAKEIVDLLHSMMSEMKKNIGLCAVQLFYTARNIFEMYCAVVPLYHKKFMETLPQQVAIFHNNCLYFSHSLIHMVTELDPKIRKELERHLCIFLEQAVCLKKLAAEKFEFSVMNQRNQLIYILKDSGFARLNEDPRLDPDAEKSLRRCIRQLQILQKVWNEVLFVNIYNRAMGFLIDAVFEELILLIISTEDISSQTASDLVSNFVMLKERVTNLFADEIEIKRHSKIWKKFTEFILILKGTLRDIDDRWANGMGPLAMEFTPEQLKHLIRALFQNSNKRAALLAKIR